MCMPTGGIKKWGDHIHNNCKLQYQYMYTVLISTGISVIHRELPTVSHNYSSPLTPLMCFRERPPSVFVEGWSSDDVELWEGRTVTPLVPIW